MSRLNPLAFRRERLRRGQARLVDISDWKQRDCFRQAGVLCCTGADDAGRSRGISMDVLYDNRLRSKQQQCCH